MRHHTKSYYRYGSLRIEMHNPPYTFEDSCTPLGTSNKSCSTASSHRSKGWGKREKKIMAKIVRLVTQLQRDTLALSQKYMP